MRAVQTVVTAGLGGFGFGFGLASARWRFGAARPGRATSQTRPVEGLRVLLTPTRQGGETLGLAERLEALGCQVTRIATSAQAALVLAFSTFDLFAVDLVPEDGDSAAVRDTVGRLAPMLPMLVRCDAPHMARPLLRGWTARCVVLDGDAQAARLQAELAAMTGERGRRVARPIR